MTHEYRSNESRQSIPERSQRPGRHDESSYGSKSYGDDESRRSASDHRDYSDSTDSNMGDRNLSNRGKRDTNAPLEWDGRRYGRDFNDDNTDGGRGIYERSSGSRYNNPSYASEREPYDSGAFPDQRYAATASGYRNQRDRGHGRSDYGQGSGQNYGGYSSSSYGDEHNQRYSQRAQQSAEREGRSNFGSNRYGGSDDGSNDYETSENRYSTPYSDASSNRVTGSNWNRTMGSGEWASRENAGSLGEAYGRSSGQAYDQVYGRQSRDSNRDPSYRGKGPKDYKRSDDRLKEIACELLMEAPHIDASDITVEAKNGEITLKGSVSDRRAKHAAEDLLEGRAGVTEIHNQLRIQSRSEGPQSDRESARQSNTTDSQRQDLSPSSTLSTSSVSNSINATGSNKDKQDGDNKGSDKGK
jgi:osmotically-inducible protein OsmY